MLYLIGGASRAGKTILAGRLLAHRGVVGFSLDTPPFGVPFCDTGAVFEPALAAAERALIV